MVERQLVYNAVQCLACGKTIESSHRHDYRVCGCDNQAMVDGGLAYQRYGAMDMTKILTKQVFADEDYFKVREYAFRLHTTDGAVRLKDMSDSWLQNAYSWEVGHGRENNWHAQLLKKELNYRNEANIQVEEISLTEAEREEKRANRRREDEEAGRILPL